MRILGLDPGLSNFGWAILNLTRQRPRVDASGCWKTEPEFSTRERIEQLKANLWEILELNGLHAVSVESWTFQRSKVGFYSVVPRVVEAVHSVCQMRPIDCLEITTGQAKSAAGLTGKCSKKRVGLWVRNFCDGDYPSTNHARDAVLVAFAAGRRVRRAA